MKITNNQIFKWYPGVLKCIDIYYCVYDVRSCLQSKQQRKDIECIKGEAGCHDEFEVI